MSTDAARFDAFERATAGLEPPLGVIDLAALRANAADMVRRAGGKPIRLASKSIRARAILRMVHEMPGFAGVLAFTLPEAHWLATEFDDVLVAYPSTDRDALRALARDEQAAARITVMIDSAEHLDFITAAVGAGGHPVRICLDIDASLRVGARVHLGMRRSPLHSVVQVRALARRTADTPGVRLVGLMSYEGHIAGVGDDAPGSVLRRTAIRAMQRVSIAELRRRRDAIVTAVRAIAPLEFVNGGGTGSLETTAAESAITELGAGSGLYAPTLFDTYRSFHPTPAAYFALAVDRRPAPDIATVLGGGWIASGVPGPDRAPRPVWPPGLALIGTEGAGEVQTPVRGESARGLRLGDRVWFRHTKAGELCERLDALALIDGDAVVDTIPTYRGEGKTFV
ncbi:amino acid deaminase/aldolase [Mycolicibacterium brumae]|uniref:Alanine racemase n=1 Tax=Mycolicibacterium brumae TaxID=85968 RepID=A0A2G5PGF7_9MYCO|nr:amino acid deaminase/aldolase [Mycolicibacterium brumae]MCV7194374.1 amino acid deaminase/aldolase [Mycolicibacterium brumae]PIB77230.1 alanine racemase [Mycolicibacterium brumae]RWA15475.1 hypothetical protein MBRU_10520 [Mycolicibacterium brumae DSM 44177]UWW10588.1 amino acid deaminase/aldolase [Mycolicibacterium brumae]